MLWISFILKMSMKCTWLTVLQDVTVCECLLGLQLSCNGVKFVSFLSSVLIPEINPLLMNIYSHIVLVRCSAELTMSITESAAELAVSHCSHRQRRNGAFLLCQASLIHIDHCSQKSNVRGFHPQNSQKIKNSPPYFWLHSQISCISKNILCIGDSSTHCSCGKCCTPW